MKTKLTKNAIIFFLLFSLSCNFATSLVYGTPTPAATATPSPTITPSPTLLAPAYVPASCDQNALATIPAETQMAQVTPTPQDNPDLSKQKQLQVFDEVLETIHAEYLYPDFNGTGWETLAADTRKEISNGLSAQDFYFKIQELIYNIGDEHSFYESPADVAQQEAQFNGRNEYVGIGVITDPVEEKGIVTILIVFPDSPAEHAGLKPHDSISTIDGVPVFDGTAFHPERMRGPECSAVILTVQSPNEDPREVMIIRNRISSGTPVEARLVTTEDGSRIGYINIPTFFEADITNQVEDALNNFGELDGLILDNRLNSGGSSSVVEPILSFFTDGSLGYYKNAHGKHSFRVNANPIFNSQTVPLIVLVGDYTASYGEIFSGILQDVGRAQVVGKTSPGNVEVLYGYNFSDGSQIWMAHDTFEPYFSKANWEETGIVPNLEAFASWETFTFETDPAIAAALELLGHK